MHRIAEFGIAAHWDYKANNRKLPSLTGSASSQDSKTSHGSEYIGALDTAREHLQGSSVYVFLAGTISDLEGGLILSMKAGSQVVDILKELSNMFDIETS
jgi:(p)ppGpp synthase/HD superfamily hydrolase